MNKVILHGRIGRKPETRHLSGDQSVTSFSLATSRKYKDTSGQQQEDTQWHNCQAWGRRGQAIAQYLDKGDAVLLEGELRTRSYEKEGQTHYRTEITVLQFEFGAKARRGPGAEDAPPPVNEYAAPAATPAATAAAASSDDLPF